MEHLSLPAVATSAGVGRTFVAGFCLRHGVSDDAADDAVLITSELLGNVYLHVRGVADLRIAFQDEILRIEVGDGSTDLPQPAPASPDDTGGRGVLIMDALAASWGTWAEAGGKTVWFELRG